MHLCAPRDVSSWWIYKVAPIDIFDQAVSFGDFLKQQMDSSLTGLDIEGMEDYAYQAPTSPECVATDISETEAWCGVLRGLLNGTRWLQGPNPQLRCAPMVFLLPAPPSPHVVFVFKLDDGGNCIVASEVLLPWLGKPEPAASPGSPPEVEGSDQRLSIDARGLGREDLHMLTRYRKSRIKDEPYRTDRGVYDTRNALVDLDGGIEGRVSARLAISGTPSDTKYQEATLDIIVETGAGAYEIRSEDIEDGVRVHIKGGLEIEAIRHAILGVLVPPTD